MVGPTWTDTNPLSAALGGDRPGPHYPLVAYHGVLAVDATLPRAVVPLPP